MFIIGEFLSKGLRKESWFSVLVVIGHNVNLRGDSICDQHISKHVLADLLNTFSVVLSSEQSVDVGSSKPTEDAKDDNEN